MARYSDIGTAFSAAVKREPNGRLIVTSLDFVRELEAVHHHWTLSRANAWIERCQIYFRDYTPHHGDEKSYFMIGMGRIL